MKNSISLWLLALAGLTAVAAPARADLLSRPRGHFVDGGVTLRVAMMDPSNRDDYGALSEYGYDTGRVGIGLRMAGGFRAHPLLDLGIGAEYYYEDDGSPRRKTIGMRTHVRQLGVFARPHQMSSGGLFDLGSRFEVGVMQSITTLRQQDLEKVSPYVRAQVELVIGRRNLGALLQVGYLVVAAQDDFDPYVAPRLGGISCSVGIFHRFR